MPFPSFTPRRALLAAALAAGLSPALSGFTVSGNSYVTDGSQADVQAALYTAPAGAAVKMPAGTFTWGDNATRTYITKALTLSGAGAGSTTIQISATGPAGQNALINILAAAVVRDFSIQGANAPVPVFSAGGANGWRITNITYVPYIPQGSLTGVGSYFCLVNGTYGLIDNCNITGAVGNNELIFGRGPSNSWQTDSSMGTVNNVFIEDCTFNGFGYVCDANSYARFVVRYCTINGPMKIDGHGVASNTPPRSVRHMEVYGNTWTSNNATYPAIEIRGGTGMVFNNQAINAKATSAWLFLTDYGYTSVWPNFGVKIATVSIGNPTVITTLSPHGLSDGMLVNISSPSSSPALSPSTSYPVTLVNATTFTIPVKIDVPGTGGYVTRYQTPNDYPVNDQIGVGKDPKIAGSEPMYVWNNKAAAATNAGAATTDWTLTWKQIPQAAVDTYMSEPHGQATTFAMTDVIKSDQDYFKDTASFNGSSGVGFGTVQQMNALTPTKVGVGFWVTDEADWNKKVSGPDGQLYVWNGSAWVLKYTPFTYPHPLRAPTAPTNVRIQSVP